MIASVAVLKNEEVDNFLIASVQVQDSNSEIPFKFVDIHV